MKTTFNFDKVNVSIRYNLYIAIFISLWIFFFLFLIKPFNQESLQIKYLARIAFGMSLITFLNYLIIILLQRIVYHYLKKWTVYLEVFTIFIFSGLLLFSVFRYYKSDYTKGYYHFFDFLINYFIPTLFILLPILLFLRKYIVKYIPIREEDITISGENKLDYLKIKSNKLICISSAQNYVELFFLNSNTIEKKLIRTSLKKIHKDLPFLVKVHRSHLINPTHFISFKNQKVLLLTQKEIPFSKKYKEVILSL